MLEKKRHMLIKKRKKIFDHEVKLTWVNSKIATGGVQ